MAEKKQIPDFLKLIADLLATPKGQEVAKDFNTAKDVSGQIAYDVVTTPSRVAMGFKDVLDNGGIENADPDELGRLAVEGGTMPLFGALGGVPRNAAGQVVALEHGNPLKLATMGAAAGGAGTAAYDLSQGDLDKLDWDYILDRAGPNAAKGAALGFGTGVVGELLDEADWAKRQFTRNARPSREWTDLPPSMSPPKPPVPPGSGAGRPGSAPAGSSLAQPQSAPAGRQAPPPAPPGSGQPSRAPTRSQSGGSQTSPETLEAPDGYGANHTAGARLYLDWLFDPTNPRGATPEKVASELGPYFKGLKSVSPESVRGRAANTLELLRKSLPRDLSTADRATVTRAIREATGKAGTLGIAGAAVADDDLEALLAEIMGGGG